MINKDVTHPRMRRYIKNPRIVLLDSSLEYKKGESQVRALALFRKVDVRLFLYQGGKKCLVHAYCVTFICSLWFLQQPLRANDTDFYFTDEGSVAQKS